MLRLHLKQSALVSVFVSIGQSQTPPSIPLSKFANPAEQATLRRLGGPWAEQAHTFDPFDRRIERSNLPANVTENATQWARMILRAKYLPDDIDALWAGYKKTNGLDELAVAYSVKVDATTYDIAWVDNAIYMDFFVRPVPQGPIMSQHLEDSVRGWAIDAARRFLRVPKGWEASLVPTDKAKRAFLTDEASGDGPSICYGMLFTTNKKGQITVGQKGNVSWYDHLVYWTDSNTFCFEMVGWDQGRQKWPRLTHGDRGWELPHD